MDKRTWVFIAIMIGFISGGLLYRHFAQDVDSRGATRLMRAIEENDTGKALKLLSTEDINVRDKSGQTALFYAAKHVTEPKVIYKLIVAGADPMALDKAGNTPLVTAAKYNPSAEIVMALAKHSQRALQQQENKDKALIKAAKYNTAEVIKTLLIAQASPAAFESNGKGAAEYLADNEKLTEQEKNDYRQVMLILEILEGREKFAKFAAAAQSKPKEKTESKNQQTSIQKSADKKVKSTQEVKTIASAAEETPVADPQTQAGSIPQERSMGTNETN